MSRYLKLLKKHIPNSNLEGPVTLSSSVRRGILDISRQELMRLEAPSGVPKRKFNAARKRLLDAAPAALEQLSADQSEANLTTSHRFSLEAIVRADGTRNGFYINNDTLDFDADKMRLGTWHNRAFEARNALAKAAKSVGRVDVVDGENLIPLGTCFAIAPNKIATNRHVLQAVAQKQSGGNWGDWQSWFDVLINFKGERDDDGEATFQVSRVVFAGSQTIPEIANPKLLDLAVLEVTAIDGASFPNAMSFDKSGASAGGKIQKDKRLYVLGFPINPGNEEASDLAIVFGEHFGVKQWSPGHILHGPGLPHDERHWMFTHDASTLPGSSGSLIMDFEDVDTPLAIGLHFAGESGEFNNAHVMSELETFMKDAIFL